MRIVTGESDLRGAKAPRAVFENETNLRDAKLDGANLRFCKFLRVDLRGASLRDAEVNDEVTFASCEVRGAAVKRITLDSLKQFGELPLGQVATMDIIDDVVTLRASFSGFWQWIHLVALTVFVAPYAWYLVFEWIGRPRGDFTGDTEPLLLGLGRYIWSGGASWHGDHGFSVSFIFFLVALGYNALRAALLCKTKQLELKQQSSGLRVDFSLDAATSEFALILKKPEWLHWATIPIRWKYLYASNKYAFRLHLAVVLANSVLFLWTPVAVRWVQ